MNWPQIVVIVLMALHVGVHLSKHGCKVEQNFSFYMAVSRICIWTALLYFGGFWK